MQAAVVPASAQAVRGRSNTDQMIRDLGADEVVRDGKSLAAAGGADGSAWAPIVTRRPSGRNPCVLSTIDLVEFEVLRITFPDEIH